MELVCDWCKEPFWRCPAEVRRCVRRGIKTKFCSGSCSARYRNLVRAPRYLHLIIVCGHCGERFNTTTHPRTAWRFCSRSCASAGSVTPHRRRRQREAGRARPPTIEMLAASLRAREAWKYRAVSDRLVQLGVDHTFEYVLRRYVYDLALHQQKLLVEFDGPEHRLDHRTVSKDLRKTVAARRRGWRLRRVCVEPNAEIPSEVVDDILNM